MRQNYRYLKINELSKLICEQSVSPFAVVEAYLKRLKKLNPRLNAFITVLEVQALKEAQKAESDIKEGKWRGPLHGIPVGIKDFYDTAGIKKTAALEHFKDRVPKKNAAVVTKLSEAACVTRHLTPMR